MKSLEVRIAGDQLIEEKIFPKKHFVVCSIITFFLFSLPSIYLWSIHTYKSSYSNNRVFRVALVIVVAGWCSLCAYKKWGRLCVLPLNGHIFLLCYLRWMEEKSGHSFIIEV